MRTFAVMVCASAGFQNPSTVLKIDSLRRPERVSVTASTFPASAPSPQKCGDWIVGLVWLRVGKLEGQGVVLKSQKPLSDLQEVRLQHDLLPSPECTARKPVGSQVLKVWCGGTGRSNGPDLQTRGQDPALLFLYNKEFVWSLPLVPGTEPLKSLEGAPWFTPEFMGRRWLWMEAHQQRDPPYDYQGGAWSLGRSRGLEIDLSILPV